tara:strand:- start:1037 stop:1264 length:228 start_codon:yes stop_codon:yes gene_type:complete
MDKIKKEVLETLSKKLKIPIDKFSITEKIENFKNWDSLKNVEILIDLQKKTKKKFDFTKFANVKTINDLIKLLKK